MQKIYISSIIKINLFIKLYYCILHYFLPEYTTFKIYSTIIPALIEKSWRIKVKLCPTPTVKNDILFLLIISCYLPVKDCHIFFFIFLSYKVQIWGVQLFMNQRVGKYWKATFMSGSNKTCFQPSNINFSCPVRAIKRKDMSQGYKVKYSFPSSSKMQTKSLRQLEKGHGPGKCNATPLPTCFLQFVVRTTLLLTRSSAVPSKLWLVGTCWWGSRDWLKIA